jgi:DNA invertase Pin-like site-specific DNA recombinase
MADGKFVAYYRVSTERQGKSGLGLEAQQEAVRSYLNGGAWTLVEEFTEVESGKKNDRPQLEAAKASAKKHKATLVIAKLDRLARNMAFIAKLMDEGCDFIAVDNPHATRLTLHILAAVAEHERLMISERTKSALAAAKARGKALGTNGRKLAATNKAQAAARLAPLADRLRSLRDQGLSIRWIAECLNVDGVRSPAGKQWHPANVHRALKRLDEMDRDPENATPNS